MKSGAEQNKVHGRDNDASAASQVFVSATLNANRTDLNQGLFLYAFSNSTGNPENITLKIGSQVIVYIFADAGLEVKAGIDNEIRPIDLGNYAMLVYPLKTWDLQITLNAGSALKMVCITIAELHAIFGNFDQQMMRDALRNYRQQEFIITREFGPAVKTIIHQLFHTKGDGISNLVFKKGKIMEFLAQFLESSDKTPGMEADCPYITNAMDWEKIRSAEQIIKENLINPPTIKELAKKVGTNEFKLKVGFKHLYKNTIYGYLNDYRMEFARELLGKKNVLIKEISEKVGYSNSSHFIASFKKKFGITPKQYLADSK